MRCSVVRNAIVTGLAPIGAGLLLCLFVAAPAPGNRPPARGAAAGGAAARGEVWHFVTEPNLHPMRVSVQVRQPGLAPGLIFVAPYALPATPGTLVGQSGVLIMDNEGNPVYFRGLPVAKQEQVTDFRAQILNGQPVLTWWQGQLSGAVESVLPPGCALPGARFFILDNHYRLVRTISARNGFTSDVHEFLLTTRGTALFSAIQRVFADLTPYGGVAGGSYMDDAIQEIDLRTGRLVFEWHMSDHVPLSDSIVPAPTSPDEVWDPYHLNSIDEGTDGRLLVSARHTWAVFEISRDTGDILWQIGGKQNQFSFPPDAAFYWQHHARYRPGGISLFDDGCCGPPYLDPLQEGHGLILDLDFDNFTASVRRAYPHDPVLFPSSQGDMQALSNGNEFIGWGSEPHYSEYAADGTVLYDVLMPGADLSYRAFRNTWAGFPSTPPRVAVREAGGRRVVYASWNGSTETAAWLLLAGRFPAVLSPVARFPRTGFETAMATDAAGPVYRVKALDAGGRVLATSGVAFYTGP